MNDMDETIPTPSALAAELRSLATGVRLMAILFTLLAAFINCRTAFLISSFQKIFMDAMPGQELPFMTLMVIKYRLLLISLSLGWPLLAILLAFFVRDHRVALGSLATVFILVVAQYMITSSALESPMTNLLRGMSSGT